MSMVVDTCVILDVLDRDPVFGAASAEAIDRYAEGGLLISPLTYVELAPAFLGDETRERDFLFEIGIDLPPTFGEDDLSLAHAAWNNHIQRKRSGKVAKRPVADVMIGALAQATNGLITRNADDFRALFPTLNIVTP
ncbi:MAG: type II toxin-antitoxin system VapC family toxin [Kiritimatiellae bacterium]|nr:type II toxin-antitoxin system VapC family toxin [Kiritimatiellia bacterium]